jgi:hypothetical protein
VLFSRQVCSALRCVHVPGCSRSARVCSHRTRSVVPGRPGWLSLARWARRSRVSRGRAAASVGSSRPATFVARGPSLRRSPASAASAPLLRLPTPAVSPARPEEGLTWPQGRGDAPLLHLPLGAGMTRLLVLGRSRLETSSASLFPCPALPLDGTDAPLSRAAPGRARPAMPPLSHQLCTCSCCRRHARSPHFNTPDHRAHPHAFSPQCGLGLGTAPPFQFTLHWFPSPSPRASRRHRECYGRPTSPSFCRAR